MKKVVLLVVALIFSFSMTVAAVEKAEVPDTSEPVKVADIEKDDIKKGDVKKDKTEKSKKKNVKKSKDKKSKKSSKKDEKIVEDAESEVPAAPAAK